MLTQAITNKHLLTALLMLGVTILLLSLVPPVLSFAGLGAISLIIGIIIIKLTRLDETRKRNVLKIVFLFFIVTALSLGCTIKVPMNPNVGTLDIKEKLPVEAGLLITEETKNYVFIGHPESFTASGRPHEFALGDSLEKASTQTFSQMFQKVTLVRTSEEAKKYKITIEPKIEDFHFQYDALSYAGFAVAVLSRIKVRVTLSSGEVLVWEKSIESPEQKRGPWVINIDYDKDVGESASDALVFTLRRFAVEITEDPDIRKFTGKIALPLSHPIAP